MEKHYNIALRRLRKGQHFSAPCLGTREFGAKVELIEDGAIPQSPLKEIVIWAGCYTTWIFQTQKTSSPKFFKATLSDGVLDLTNLTLAR